VRRRGSVGRESDRLTAQLAAHQVIARGGGVALVEDQVDDGERAAETLRQLLVAPNAIGDVRVGDLGLCARDARTHGGLRRPRTRAISPS